LDKVGFMMRDVGFNSRNSRHDEKVSRVYPPPLFDGGKLLGDELSVKKYRGIRNYEITGFIFERYSRLDLE
jgi:hypothetical protein